MPKDKVSKSASSPKAAGKRAKKDPNAPKRNLSAFMLFSQAERANIKQKNPDATFGQLGKLLGEAWKELSDKDKAPYQAKADAGKEKYVAALAAFKKDGKKEVKKDVKKASSKAVEEEDEEEEDDLEDE